MAEKTITQVQVTALRSLYLALGWKSAGGWPAEKMKKMIEQIKDVAKPANELTEADAKTQTEILAGLESGSDFALEGVEDTVADEQPGDEKVTTGKTAEDKAKAKKEKEEAAAKAKADKEEAKAKAKKEKEEAAAKAKADKEAAKAAAKPASLTRPASPVAGIRPVRSRIYLGCQLLKECGSLAAVNIDELAVKLDAMCEDSNLKESKAWLKVAWHAVNGYTGEFPVEPKKSGTEGESKKTEGETDAE